MKLTTFILIIALAQVNARGFGQRVTLNETNTPLEKILKVIKQQTGYDFIYDANDLKGQQVTVKMNNVSVEDAVAASIRNLPLAFKIVKNNIVLTKVEPSLLDKLSSVISNIVRDLTVKGRVVDQNGKPLPNASIQVKGKNAVFTSNKDGEFSIPDVPEDAILVVRYVGYKIFEIAVKDMVMPFEIKLNALTGELREVNIKYATGFQQLPKERATGSFVQIDNELLNRSVSTGILSRLQGITSGLVFDKGTSNDLGISIRGRSTISANTQPLIVVDNFPYKGDINTINPNDVESVTILKDAAAASIWGAYSGNGVIVISTKKGRFNQPLKIRTSSNLTIGQKPDLFYSQQFMNSSDFIDVERYLFDKNFYDADLTNPAQPPISPVVEILDKLRSGGLSQNDATAQITALRGLDIRNDYSKYFYRQEVKQQHAINLGGGNDKLNFLFSAGFDKNLFNTVRNQDERLTMNTTAIFRPLKNLEITAGINYVYGISRNNGMELISAEGKYGNMYPYAQLADERGNPMSVINKYREIFAQNATNQGLLSWQYYPLTELKLNDNVAKSHNNRITAGLKYTLFPGLNAELNCQLFKNQTNQPVIYPVESYYARDIINRYSIVQNNSVSKRNVPLGGISTDRYGNLTANDGRIQLNYNQKFGKHELFGIVGAGFQESRAEGSRNTLYGYDPATGTSAPVDFINQYPVYPTGALQTITGAPAAIPYTLDRFRSYFGNLSYTYAEKYTLSASARLDQSNLFGVKTNQKGVPLWSVGGKWGLDKESFYAVNWLPSLSLRATYGFNGNLDRSLSALTTAVFSQNSQYNNSAYATIYNPGNPELRWEKIGMLNLGLDFGLVNNVLTGSIEYFHKKGTDLIGTSFVPSSTGFRTFKGNFSNMVGQGLDVALAGRFNVGTVQWEMNGLFSHASDKITKNEATDRLQPGKPVHGIFSLPWAGLDNSGDPLGYLDGIPSKDYANILDQAAKDVNAYVYNGPGSPQFFGGFRNTISWKKFSLSANITYKLGHFFKRRSIDYPALYNSSTMHSDFTSRWKQAGDEMHTNVPAMVFTDYPQFINRNNFYSDAEVLIEKADHIRLQDVNFSYAIGKNQWAKLPFNSVRIFFYANNLGLLWKANDKGIDPDFTTGFVNPKTFSLGVNLDL